MKAAQQGGSLIEVLVTLVVLLVGLLGLAGLMVQSQRAQMESYQRVQALLMLEDMVNRINTNRKAAACYAYSAQTGAPYLGTGSSLTPSCTSGTVAQQARALADLGEWHALLRGAAEVLEGAQVGGALAARGCVAQLSPGVYQVSVVWQGLTRTSAPVGVSCALNTYGDEALRRAVSATVQIASLS